MKVFIWQGVADLTQNYHSGGGLVIVADTLERAWELVPAANGMVPDQTYTLAEPVKEETYIFPDAGCC